MRITEAAQALGTSPRMLRYRESLGLLPRTRERRRAGGRGSASRDVAGRPGARAGAAGTRAGAPGHRQFTEADLAAAALGLGIERRYDISPAALAFGIRVLADPRVRADVAELGRRIGRIAPPPARALDFEQERALRLLRMDPRRPPGQGAPARGAPAQGPSARARPPQARAGQVPPGPAPAAAAWPGQAPPGTRGAAPASRHPGGSR